jgi:hypothetical protein
VGPRAGLDVSEKSRPHRDSIPGPSLHRLSYPGPLYVSVPILIYVLPICIQIAGQLCDYSLRSGGVLDAFCKN